MEKKNREHRIAELEGLPRRLVVVDAGPLIHLARIGLLTLLQEEYGVIWATKTVFEEVAIRKPGAPGAAEIGSRDWIYVVPDPEIPLRLYQRGQKLDRGELTSLALCLEHPGSIALMDDQAGRIAAHALGISLSGTLGILLTAKKKGRIASVLEAIEDLKAGGFWVAAELREKLRLQAGE